MEQGMEYLVELAVKKKKMLDTNPKQYLLRAALAGIYIGFVIIVCFKLGEFFRAANSPATYLASSFFFGTALVLIMYGGAELFTGNTMYFTVATMRKETTVMDTLKNWTACYAGNLIGAVFFAILFYATGIFEHISNEHLLNQVAGIKMNATTTHLFFKGLLCNWLVCLACFLPSRVKGDGAKIAIMMLIVFAFFLSGYEHSIANLSLFSLALLLPHPDTITLAGALHNLIPVTLGNIVGGAVFVGMVYQYLSKPAPVKEQASDDAQELIRLKTAAKA
ncbi:formate/nitrite transporter family protein [Ectobacillus panaciterrae]|uniref:formate/nitrite transporter family protein n=1 Tax=Ectobacillus panaciterrae TaxID=363872 RepID=UPI0004056B9D|nr:formate/nitrite transporter family protein [Ectobacillus panaciterrae]